MMCPLMQKANGNVPQMQKIWSKRSNKSVKFEVFLDFLIPKSPFFVSSLLPSFRSIFISQNVKVSPHSKCLGQFPLFNVDCHFLDNLLSRVQEKGIKTKNLNKKKYRFWCLHHSHIFSPHIFFLKE